MMKTFKLYLGEGVVRTKVVRQLTDLSTSRSNIDSRHRRMEIWLGQLGYISF